VNDQPVEMVDMEEIGRVTSLLTRQTTRIRGLSLKSEHPEI